MQDNMSPVTSSSKRNHAWKAVLAVLLAAFSLVSAPQARAATLFPTPGLLELLPVGSVIGDGSNPVMMHVMALDPNGAAFSELKLKISTTGGNAGGAQDLGNGLYRFALMPPKVDAERTIELTLKAKTPEKETLTKTYALTVVPASARRIQVTASPDSLLLGRDDAATLTIDLSGTAAGDISKTQLAVTTTSGQVTNLTHLGDSRWSARYEPPKQQYPQLALITVSDQNDPSRTYGHARIRLIGKTPYPIAAAPNATVILSVSGRDFGPVMTDSAGKAKLPIEVPPGIGEITQITTVGAETQRDLKKLKVPTSPRIALMALPAGVPADDRVTIPVRAVVSTATGAPDEQAYIQITATAGTVTEARHEGDGVYVADYRPPTGNATVRATLVASLPQEPGQASSADVSLAPVRPSGIALTPDPKKMAATAEGFHILAKVNGHSGTGLAGRDLRFTANGARLVGTVKDLKGGDYKAAFATKGKNLPADVSVAVSTPATGNPLREILLIPARTRLPNDGLSSSMLTVMTLDEFGYPVGNVVVSLSLAAGDGSLPSTVTTGAMGMAQVYYTAGRNAGVVNIQGRAGNYVGGAPILQAPLDVVTGLTLPVSGTESTREHAASWSNNIQTVRVEREGATGALLPVESKPDTGAPGALAKLVMNVEPGSIVPGGSVTLKVRATDENDRGIGGIAFDLVASDASSGPITDQGNGNYTVKLTAENSAQGHIKVTVVADEGAKAAFRRISVVGDPIVEAPAVAEPVQEEPATPEQPEPAQAEEVAEEPAVAEAAPMPEPAPTPSEGTATATEDDMLSVRATTGPGGYRYIYTVHSTPKQLVAEGDPIPFGRSLELTGTSSDGEPTPMLAPTLDIAVEGWLPQLPLVGAEIRYRSTWFGVDTEAFAQGSDGIDLSWFDTFITATAKGRYSIESGGMTYTAALSGGFVYTAMPIVAEWSPAWTEDRGLWFYPWSFISLYGDATVGVEMENGLDARIILGMGTEAYSGVFATDTTLNVSYPINDMFSAHAMYNRLQRAIIIPESAESSTAMITAEDIRAGFSLGVGASF